MPSEVVTEFMLVILVIVIGIAVMGFSFAFLLPQIAFSNAQNQASNIASSSSVSVSPLLISPTSPSGSIVAELYNPIYNGTVYITAFVVPSYYETSSGVVTPTTTPTLTIYFPNGSVASSLSISTVYDTNGKILYQGKLPVYKVLFNTPLTIVVNNVNSNNIVVVWYIINEGGYYFRIAYTYTGVPSTR